MTTISASAPFLRGGGRIENDLVSYEPPGPGQLLLRARANALCGTDRGIYEHGNAVVAGHEAAGEVIGAGAGTTTEVGTRGVVYLMAYCGSCASCSRGLTNLCRDKHGDIGLNRHGGLGPYVLVQERSFFPIDDDVPFPLATMLLDVMGTNGHVLDRAERTLPEIRSLHVVGAGPVGIGTLVMARIRYGDALPITVSDVADWRLRFATSLGASTVLHPEDVATSEPVDLAVDTSGRTAARQAAFARLERPGTLVCVGHGGELSLHVSPDLIASERTVLGSEYFPFADLERNAALLRRHREAIAAIITDELDVAELDQAFATFLSGRSGKVVVTQS